MSRFHFRERLKTFIRGTASKSAPSQNELNDENRNDDVYQQILRWKYAINASCVRWAFTEAYFRLGVVDNIQIVEDEAARYGHRALFKNQETIVDSADIAFIATWSNISNSFWWTWAQDSFRQQYPEYSIRIKHLLLEGRDGIERFCRDDISEIFNTHKQQLFDWSNRKECERYKHIQYISADQLDSDGWNWLRREEGDTLYAYYFNGITQQSLLSYCTSFVEYWTRQVFLHCVYRLKPLFIESYLEGAEAMASYVREAVDAKSPSSSRAMAEPEPDADKRDLETLYKHARWLKCQPVSVNTTIEICSKDEWGDPYLRAFLDFILRLSQAMYNETKSSDESDLDRQAFDNNVLPVLDLVTSEAKRSAIKGEQ
jgi:hypothetical protein